MTVEQFTAQLRRFGESLQDLQPELQDLAERVVADLRADIRAQNLVDTGALLNSVRAQATSNTLEISMLAYGMYNNYGVAGERGVKSGSVIPVEFGVQPPPRQGHSVYQFRKREFGIPSRQFFKLSDFQNQLAEEITTTITGTFN